jgi:6,7-dimethyl-8-ribityllumazine synthase
MIESQFTATGLSHLKMKNIAFVEGEWHSEVVARAREGFIHTWRENGLSTDAIKKFSVPGAYELPLFCKKLALSGKFDAIIACGLVVDGGIYRHDFVASTVVQGLMSVQLETLIPVFSVVLTPHHFQPNEAQEDFYRNHFIVKGKEACSACLKTLTSSVFA